VPEEEEQGREGEAGLDPGGVGGLMRATPGEGNEAEGDEADGGDGIEEGTAGDGKGIGRSGGQAAPGQIVAG
jgi:hypothetical protein